jgi:hypothetical protein
MSRRTLVAAVIAALMIGLGLAGPASATKLPSRSQWLSDVRTALSGSSGYVDARVARGGKRLAINFDIDNTSIQTHYAYPKAVGPTLRLATHARSKGVTILFNTGRYQSQLGGIRKALTKAGYVYAEVCGRKKGGGLTTSKQRCRQHFVDEGYTLIANVGNRGTDFVGGNYEKAYRLPNYAKLLS